MEGAAWSWKFQRVSSHPICSSGRVRCSSGRRRAPTQFQSTTVTPSIASSPEENGDVAGPWRRLTSKTPPWVLAGDRTFYEATPGNLGSVLILLHSRWPTPGDGIQRARVVLPVVPLDAIGTGALAQRIQREAGRAAGYHRYEPEEPDLDIE